MTASAVSLQISAEPSTARIITLIALHYYPSRQARHCIHRAVVGGRTSWAYYIVLSVPVPDAMLSAWPLCRLVFLGQASSAWCADRPVLLPQQRVLLKGADATALDLLAGGTNLRGLFS